MQTGVGHAHCHLIERICRKGSSLDLWQLSRTRHRAVAGSCLPSQALLPRPCTFRHLLHPRLAIVVGQFDPNFPGIAALAGQGVPVVFLATAWLQNGVNVDPGFANEIGLFVIIEDGKFEVSVVGSVVYNESQLLVPRRRDKMLADGTKRGIVQTNHFGV